MHAIQFQTRDHNFRALDLRVNVRAHATGSVLRIERLSSLRADGGVVGWAQTSCVSASAMPSGRAMARTVLAPQRVLCSLFV